MLEDVLIHPNALVETDQIGPGTRIWAFAHVMRNAVIGANCNIGDHCFVESGAVIGANVTVKNGNMIWDGVVLEDGVFVGPHVFFTNDRHPRSPRLPEAQARYANRTWLEPTIVRRGASLGAGAALVAGITVGDYAMVGAGAVVTHDVPAHALVLGVPAHICGWVCCCGQPLSFSDGAAECGACGLSFRAQDDRIAPVS